MEDQASAHMTKDSEFPKVILATTATMEHKNLHHTWGECNNLLLHIFHKAWGWILGDKIFLILHLVQEME